MTGFCLPPSLPASPPLHLCPESVILTSFSDSQEWTNQFLSYCLRLHSRHQVQGTGRPSELERRVVPRAQGMEQPPQGARPVSAAPRAAPRSDVLRTSSTAFLCSATTDDALVLQVSGFSHLCHTSVPHSATMSVHGIAGSASPASFENCVCLSPRLRLHRALI